MTLSGFSRIAADPAVCGGRPVIVGTRMKVGDHHFAPCAAKAASNAFLLAVRSPPALRGITASVIPVASRRRSIDADSSSRLIGSRVGTSAFEVLHAIFVCRFVADTAIHIV